VEIVHERDEYTTIESETQGRTQYTPPTIRAEKSLSGGGMINEEAETMGKLLERIHAHEQHLESKGIKQTATPINEAAVPRNEAGLPIRTVLIAAEPTDLSEPAEVVAITEEEWASRARNDAIYDGKQMVFYGPAEGASDAENVRLATKRAVEDRRAREQDVGETEQLFLDDTQTAVDQPGRSAGSVLVVRSDEKDLSAEDREARNAQAENDRVVFQQNSPIGAVAPEGEEKLAGVGVGIQDRPGTRLESALAWVPPSRLWRARRKRRPRPKTAPPRRTFARTPRRPRPRRSVTTRARARPTRTRAVTRFARQASTPRRRPQKPARATLRARKLRRGTLPLTTPSAPQRPPRSSLTSTT
jgi:hypothetical protein